MSQIIATRYGPTVRQESMAGVARKGRVMAKERAVRGGLAPTLWSGVRVLFARTPSAQRMSRPDRENASPDWDRSWGRAEQAPWRLRLLDRSQRFELQI